MKSKENMTPMTIKLKREIVRVLNMKSFVRVLNINLSYPIQYVTIDYWSYSSNIE